jgi:glycosyltransferase involved in cell wall biosynthesis
LIGSFESSDPQYVDLLRRRSASNVSLVGYKHPIINYLRQERIGIVLVPSRIAEAFALVPIEAAMAGCAVIARNAGGLAEVAENTGLITVNTDNQFCEEIGRLQALDRDALRMQVQTAYRRVLARYHPDRFEQGIREVFGWR